MTNPIDSVAELFSAAGQGPQHLKLYEALCMEEAGEQMLAFDVSDGQGSAAHMHLALCGALGELSTILRGSDDLHVIVPDQSELLDAHLDSVWVHLGAALALLGGDKEKLHAAWRELHRSNIDDKKGPDGAFIKDETGKITKPAGWTKPDFDQFF